MSNQHCLTDVYTQKERTIHLYVELFFSFTCTCLVFAVCWTFYHYAYKKNVWRCKLTMIFYVLAFLAAVFSAVEFAVWGVVDYTDKPHHPQKQLAQSMAVLATVSLLNIGFF